KDLENQITDTANQLKRTKQELEDASKKLGDLEARARKEVSDFQRAANEYNRLLNLAKSLGLISIGPGGSVRYPISENINALNERVRKELEDVQKIIGDLDDFYRQRYLPTEEGLLKEKREAEKEIEDYLKAKEDFENYLKNLQKSGKVAIIGGQIQILHPGVIHPLKAKQKILEKEFTEAQKEYREFQYYYPVFMQLKQLQAIYEKEFQEYETAREELERYLKDLESRGIIKISGDTIEFPLLKQLAEQARIVEKERREALQAIQEYESFYQNVYSPLYGQYQSLYNTFQDLLKQAQNLYNTYTAQIKNLETSLKVFEPYLKVKGEILANLPQQDITYSLSVQWHHEVKEYEQTLKNLEQIGALQPGTASTITSNILQIADYVKNVHLANLKMEDLFTELQKIKSPEFLADPFVMEYIKLTIGQVPVSILANLPPEEINRIAYALAETSEAYRRDLIKQVKEMEAKDQLQVTAFSVIPIPFAVNKNVILDSLKSFGEWIKGKIDILAQYNVPPTAPIITSTTTIPNLNETFPSITPPESKVIHGVMTNKIKIDNAAWEILIGGPIRKYTEDIANTLKEIGGATAIAAIIPMSLFAAGKIGLGQALLTTGTGGLAVPIRDFFSAIVKYPRVSEMEKVFRYTEVTTDMFGMPMRVVLEKPKEELTLEEIDYLVKASKQTTLKEAIITTTATAVTTALLTWGLSKTIIEPLQIKNPPVKSFVITSDTTILGDVKVTGNIATTTGNIVQGTHVVVHVPQISPTKALMLYGWKTAKQISELQKDMTEVIVTVGRISAETTKITKNLYVTATTYQGILIRGDKITPITQDMIEYTKNLYFKVKPFITDKYITETYTVLGPDNKLYTIKVKELIPKEVRSSIFELKRIDAYLTTDYQNIITSYGFSKTHGLVIKTSPTEYYVSMIREMTATKGFPTSADVHFAGKVSIIHDTTKDILYHFVHKTSYKPFDIQNMITQAQNAIAEATKNIQINAIQTASQIAQTTNNLITVMGTATIQPLIYLLDSGVIPQTKPKISLPKEISKVILPSISIPTYEIPPIERSLSLSHALPSIEVKTIQQSTTNKIDKLNIDKTIQPQNITQINLISMENLTKQLNLTKTEQIQELEKVQITNPKINIPNIPTPSIKPAFFPPGFIPSPFSFTPGGGSQNIMKPLRKYEKAKHERYIKGFINPKFFI
ncbi:MAG: hypothetical protein QXQ19_00400, partial [Candidatus Aenigmatarchaeota archaeon]